MPNIKRTYQVGFGKPPEQSRFKPGESANPKGRPKRSKGQGAGIDDDLVEELEDRLAVTENGRRRRISKGQAAVKQLVNRAAEGDLKAMQTILKAVQARQKKPSGAAPDNGLDGPEHQLVMADIIRRIRAMDDPDDVEPNPDPEQPNPDVEDSHET